MSTDQQDKAKRAIFDPAKLSAIIHECNVHNSDIGAGNRDPEKVRKDAENIYMHRHCGITVETLCMMLTDYSFAVDAAIKNPRFLERM